MRHLARLVWQRRIASMRSPTVGCYLQLVTRATWTCTRSYRRCRKEASCPWCAPTLGGVWCSAVPEPLYCVCRWAIRFVRHRATRVVQPLVIRGPSGFLPHLRQHNRLRHPRRLCRRRHHQRYRRHRLLRRRCRHHRLLRRLIRVRIIDTATLA